jgi:hypothetical protein
MNSDSEVEPVQRLLTNVGAILALGSFAVSFYSLRTAQEANAISRQAYDRSSGRILPFFSIACSTPHLLVKSDKSSDPRTVDIAVTNIGQEPIERVRFEISVDIIWSGDRGTEQAIQPTRILHEFNKILRHGETATVDIGSGIIEHLKKIQIPKNGKCFWTPCTIECSAQIVGQEHFASISSDDGGSRGYNTTRCCLGVTRDGSGGIESKSVNFGVEPSKR